MTEDMTTGNPVKKIIYFSIPILLGNLFQQFYQVSDTIIVGRILGVESLAAVGAVSPLFFLLLIFTCGFTSGLTIVTAQCVGAKDETAIKKSVTHSVFACIFLGLLISISCLSFLHKIIIWMNIPQDISSQAYKFMSVLILGLPIIIAYNLLAGFIRALGDSKTPLYFLIFSSVLNIILNFTFIYGFKLGVEGSAYGTVGAMFIATMLCILYIKRKFTILIPSQMDWKIQMNFLYRHLRIGIPMSLQFMVIGIGLLLLQVICNTFGANAIAAFTTAFRVEQLMTQPLVALGVGMATFSAQNRGAKNLMNIKKGVYQISLLSLCLSLGIAGLMRIFGEDFILLFLKTREEEILDLAKSYINITTIFYFFLSQIYVYRNAIQGMGGVIIPLLSGIVELVMRTYAAVYLASTMGYIGICYASPIAWIGASSLLFVGYIVKIKKETQNDI